MKDDLIFEYEGTKYCIVDLLYASTQYLFLKDLCFKLLNNIKIKASDEDRKSWRCPDFQKISDAIHFE